MRNVERNIIQLANYAYTKLRVKRRETCPPDGPGYHERSDYLWRLKGVYLIHTAYLHER